MSLSVTALTKQYGGSTALNRLSVTFEPNVIYGLFGRNGAGKSTLLGCIGNRLIPDTGRIVLEGEPLAECERLMARVYLANERLPWWDGVTLSAMLADCAHMDGRFDLGLARELVARFGLSPDAVYGRLSLGQRTMARMLIGLCMPVDYLFLDEPTTGLDPVNRRLMVEAVLEAYRRRSRTIVIATHEIAEFADILERAVIIDQGRRIDSFEVQDLCSHAALLVGPSDVVRAYAAGRGLRVLDVEHRGDSVSALVGMVSASEPEGGASASVAASSGFITGGLPDGVRARTPDLQTYMTRLVQRRH